MLRITIPSGKTEDLNFNTFQNYELPAPPDGIDAEINNNVILKFEDEEEAIVYAKQLENLSNELTDKSSAQNIAIGQIITAIRNDEFVRGYQQ